MGDVHQGRTAALRLRSSAASPVWTTGRPLVRLDAAHAPEKRGAPTPSGTRCRVPRKARVTRSPVSAERCADFGLALPNSTGLPAPAAWGTGATPPSILPVRGRTSGGLGHQRVLAPPALHQPAWAGVLQGTAAGPCPAPRAAPSTVSGSEISVLELVFA